MKQNVCCRCEKEIKDNDKYMENLETGELMCERCWDDVVDGADDNKQ